ncbi:hypothetical protein [Plastoroseomonas arctica]|uniref:Uncharacterized protein n=1 Tax=Plastoroseomonas arctica TaxID=1509237 RepID=A0AAF1JZV2_9PROT|nr:hypothetical protein [Plastoroseomonas arctica]MBR0656168.1 hypothetical protein [Plastoroseomonas arctica]
MHPRYTARIAWLLPFGGPVTLLHERFGATIRVPQWSHVGLETPSESGRAATRARFPWGFARRIVKTSCFSAFSDARHAQRRQRRGNHPGRPSGDHP